jgi:uncharacterized protein YqjF (DUF2071 family)
MVALQRKPLARVRVADGDPLDALSRLRGNRGDLLRRRILAKCMNAASALPDGRAIARKRLLSLPGDPLFFASWDNALFIHYETDPAILQRCVPYRLDLFHGCAFVSLVAFTMRGMRPRLGGRLAEFLFKPIATYNFLNIRTYVRHRGEPGIYFVHEWLSHRLSVLLGPATFGLPYRFGEIDYERDHEELRGTMRARDRSFVYRAKLSAKSFETCDAGSRDEFLLERYTAFTQSRKTKRFFRIWHEPWRQVPARIEVLADNLIAGEEWYRDTQLISANYSPGVDVWMGWPHKIAALGT